MDIYGKPMIQHVYEQVSKTTFVDDIFVATDDNRIQEAVYAFEGKVILTSPGHKSGTDRVAEVARNLSSDIFINVQGDEPFISPKLIDQIASSLISDKQIQMSSACSEFKDRQEYVIPQNVKVVCDKNAYAIYFSRLPIPFSRALWLKAPGEKGWDNFFSQYSLSDIQRTGVKKHVGIYGYRRETLLKFSQWPSTPLEIEEELEQLRALEYRIKIKMVMTQESSPSIDTPEDLQKLKKAI